jgi:DNA repair exonuclease SbcCD ATPase subunit
MKISKLSINNFYSFEETEIDFSNYKGIVSVVGVNKDSGGSNGSGKSALLEAIVWSVFGKTIRKSNEQAIIHHGSKGRCSVSIEFEIDKITYKITRSRRPTSLEFERNGVNINKEKAMKTQELIDSTLKTDYKSFSAAVVFGQHSEVDFLSSSPEDKRNIIKNSLNLENIFSKRDIVKQLKSEYTATVKTYNTLLKPLEEERNKLKPLVGNKKYKYIELPKLEDILSLEKEIQKIQKKIDSDSQDISKNKAALQKLKESIDLGVHETECVCPVCKNNYVKKQTEEEVNSIKERYKELYTSTKFIHEGVEALKQEIIEKTPKISSSEWSKYNEKNQIANNEQKILDKISDIEAKILEYKSTLLDAEKNLEIMKFWEKAFSEQGLIRYVIRNILTYFNNKANEYLGVLSDGKFKIVIADDLSERIFNCGRESQYISLSGGEKRKINLSIMLALQSLQSKISKLECNLLFFDEVGENLDKISMRGVYNLLNTLTEEDKSKVLLVITHNNHLSSLMSECDTIVIEKKNGTSKICN